MEQIFNRVCTNQVWNKLCFETSVLYIPIKYCVAFESKSFDKVDNMV